MTQNYHEWAVKDNRYFQHKPTGMKYAYYTCKPYGDEVDLQLNNKRRKKLHRWLVGVMIPNIILDETRDARSAAVAAEHQVSLESLRYHVMEADRIERILKQKKMIDEMSLDPDHKK